MLHDLHCGWKTEIPAKAACSSCAFPRNTWLLSKLPELGSCINFSWDAKNKSLFIQMDHQEKTKDSTKAQPGSSMSLGLLSDHRSYIYRIVSDPKQLYHLKNLTLSLMTTSQKLHYGILLSDNVWHPRHSIISIDYLQAGLGEAEVISGGKKPRYSSSWCRPFPEEHYYLMLWFVCTC